MLKKIESLRKQPQYVRNRYAFWTAFLVTLVIAVLWGSTIPARFKTLTPEVEEKPAPSELDDFASTVGTLFTGVIDRFGAVTAEQNVEEQEGKRIDLVELVATTTVPVQEAEVSAKDTATSSVATTSEASMQASSTARGN